MQARQTVAVAAAGPKQLQLVRYASTIHSPGPVAQTACYSTTPVPPSTPYNEITIGAPKETYSNERRVALTPANVAVLLKKGFKKVVVEKGAGVEADFPDQAYAAAGATFISSSPGSQPVTPASPGQMVAP